jgi:hypothetical protein
LIDTVCLVGAYLDRLRATLLATINDNKRITL